jgi:hypothetical protein
MSRHDSEGPFCGSALNVSSLRPYQRKAFNGTLHPNFPSKPQDILTVLYGSDWKVPDPKKNTNITNCRDQARERERRRNQTAAMNK